MKQAPLNPDMLAMLEIASFRATDCIFWAHESIQYEQASGSGDFAEGSLMRVKTART